MNSHTASDIRKNHSSDRRDLWCVCIFCGRSTAANYAVCKRIKCRLIFRWHNFKYGRAAKRERKIDEIACQCKVKHWMDKENCAGVDKL